MERLSNSGPGTEKAERSLPARPPTAAGATRSPSHRQTRHSKDGAPLPPPHDGPPPPPHDAPINLKSLKLADLSTPSSAFDEKSHPLPALPPPPPSKSFYNAAKLSHSGKISPTFIESFMERHPRVSRHRRRFAAFLFTTVTVILLLIVLLAVILSRKGSSNDGNDGGGGSGNGGSGSTSQTATDEELAKHNQGISRPPINHSNATGWAWQGQGDGTYYDPSVKNGAGQFQEGACGFQFINSIHDMVVALNKPDLGAFPVASKSPACGQCLQVTGPNGTVQVQIVDMCPACESGSLDLTPGAFERIASLDAGRVHISWVRCP
ncbi:RlpA-like double-psi beta-barrel-protein domain-containing protein-containing protein [Dissophora ornata]|nr:hypothetical protein BGZ58_001852 [Dissophora ornata]KAI8605693.1 RlpA-like double-psi beta-barrel-protein domain-containing protein-containing protein [Dissophora ornata]